MDALIFGVIASSALVLGAVVGARIRLPKAMLAFAGGALITALAFELFEDAYEHGGIWRAALVCERADPVSAAPSFTSC